MEFEWDEIKPRQVHDVGGIDIVHAARIFEGHMLSRLDGRKGYGETRMVSVGLVETECFVVVHTERNGVTRLITAWIGGQRDRKRHQKSLAERDSENE